MGIRERVKLALVFSYAFRFDCSTFVSFSLTVFFSFLSDIDIASGAVYNQ